MRYIHEIDGTGQHRLGSTKYNAKSPVKESPVKWGQWAAYEVPAMLGQYLAVTEYYRGSAEFPDNNLLYRIQKDVWPLTTTLANTEE